MGDLRLGLPPVGEVHADPGRLHWAWPLVPGRDVQPLDDGRLVLMCAEPTTQFDLRVEVQPRSGDLQRTALRMLRHLLAP
ncbi:hypothetical protein ACLQ28_32790 [Micromonospora sp. DT201]|uniref:hypothetical protein n=1 Tax=Micromonospora sp. DT201 TaxID=3393442 RepID=UPI003CF8459F